MPWDGRIMLVQRGGLMIKAPVGFALRASLALGCLIGLTGCPFHFRMNVEEMRSRDAALMSANEAPHDGAWPPGEEPIPLSSEGKQSAPP
jgi:hypothetical protein